MRYFGLSAIVILASQALPAFAQAAENVAAPDGDEIPLSTPNLAVQVSTSFPASEIFGVKIVNGQATQALLSIRNNEAQPVSVAFVGGNLWAPDARTNGETSINVRNLTTARYNIKVPPGEADSVSYSFATELHPQDLRLQLVAIVTTPEGGVYTLNAFNETVSVVEPDASLFDPQLIFLYLMLAGLFAGSCYFIYNTWITTLFPQTTKPVKSGDRARKSQGGKKIDGAGSAGADGAEGQAVATGSFDASWIPDHHMNKPEAKRLKSGGGASKTKKA